MITFSDYEKTDSGATLCAEAFDLEAELSMATPQMKEIFIAMPNKHYFNVDLSKFPRSVGGCNDNEDVFLPIDKPAGYIEATLGRKQLSSKL